MNSNGLSALQLRIRKARIDDACPDCIWNALEEEYNRCEEHDDSEV